MMEETRYFINSQSVAFFLAVKTTRHMETAALAIFDKDKPGTAAARHIRHLWGSAGHRNDLHDTDKVRACGKDYEFVIQNTGYGRRLYGHTGQQGKGEPLIFDLMLSQFPPDYSKPAVPLISGGSAAYSRKLANCIVTEGRIEYGQTEYLFAPANTFAFLDSLHASKMNTQRSVCGTASGLVGGKRIGLRFGYNPESKGDPCVLTVTWQGAVAEVPGMSVKPVRQPDTGFTHFRWQFDSADHKTVFDFSPIAEVAWPAGKRFRRKKLHLVYGVYHGKLQPGVGSVIHIHDMAGFIEMVE
jgi:hypothetical protein